MTPSPMTPSPAPPSDLWLERYSRQILLSAIGGKGQERLAQSSVGILGAGTVGMTALLYLAGAGVGRLFIADDALVKPGGIHPKADLGTPKALAAANRIRTLNPTIHLEPSLCRLTPTTLIPWVEPLDLVLDCGQACAWLNPIVMAYQKPLLTTWFSKDGLGWLAGSAAGQNPLLPCLACAPIVTSPPPASPPPQEWITLWRGAAGSILATETIKILLTIGTPILWTNRLSLDPDIGEYQHHLMNKNPDCLVCSTQQPSQEIPHPMAPQNLMTMNEATIDITKETCPMTFVMIKLKLETMAPGDRLRIRLNGGEPLANIPRSLQEEGVAVSLPWKEGDCFGIMATKPAK